MVPAGAMLVHRTVYDNSSNNRGNPDPEKEVYWGLQSEEEMLYGSFGFRWLDESSDKPNHSQAYMELAQAMGVMDQNLDGLVSEQELMPRLKQRIGGEFSAFDLDSDGGLNPRELGGLFEKMRQRREVGKEPSET